jgi:hypothetical protein
VTTTTEGGKVMKLIAELPEDSQKRVWVMFEILTNLIRESGEEAELAFTLVMAGLADASEQQRTVE